MLFPPFPRPCIPHCVQVLRPRSPTQRCGPVRVESHQLDCKSGRHLGAPGPACPALESIWDMIDASQRRLQSVARHLDAHGHGAAAVEPPQQVAARKLGARSVEWTLCNPSKRNALRCRPPRLSLCSSARPLLDRNTDTPQCLHDQ
jgi:hypothetical protein